WIVNIFFFQAEDGIRDRNVTGVQTCALPISTTPGWYLGRGAISNGDVLTLEPGGRALEVTAKVWIPIRAGADYLVQVDYREAPMVGAQKIYAIALDSAGRVLSAFPDPAGYGCSPSADWIHAYFAFTAPTSSAVVEVQLQARGTGSAQFRAVQVSTISAVG